VSYLTCPTCRFTVSASRARSPFQNCPRCLLRDRQAVMMVATKEPRFRRDTDELDRITEAKARFRRPARGVNSA
jgi:ssDNA-binding Zn-finger/Zn-ribbon topoisomerase 1